MDFKDRLTQEDYLMDFKDRLTQEDYLMDFKDRFVQEGSFEKPQPLIFLVSLCSQQFSVIFTPIRKEKIRDFGHFMRQKSVK